MPEKPAKDQDFIKASDVPPGSVTASELGTNYGNTNLTEVAGSQFLWGQSIWSVARIGGNRQDVQD